MLQTLPIPFAARTQPETREPKPSLEDLVYRASLVASDAPLRRGDRKRVLGLSLAVYGLLGAAGLILSARSATALMAPSKTVTISLLEEAPLLAPPPPPAGAQATRSTGQTSTTPQEPQVAPVSTPSSPVESSLPASTVPTQGSGPGVPGGVAGGVAGGTVGGVVGGTVGGIVPPRFDAAYLQNPPPDYPSLSRRLGEEGRIILRVLISPEGLPRDIQLQASSGFPRLDQAALQTVRRWRFAPAMRGEEPLAAWVLVPIRFNLES
ncbi:energy transducer TonB [Geothrix sp.]|jgi:protein TonB|uniref:energy transducer TonB n=1 Tax=Geothrix sp. TaxID=1962974 RepID=UPI0025BDC81F|nr:energy transducer TonB [Geothrix sp.]